MSMAAQRLRALATARFPTLTPAEELLLRQVTNGEEAHYESPNDARNDIRQADTWGPERTIHAEVLRWLCVDREAIRHIDPKGLSIHGARVDGALDLRMVTIPLPLFLVRCALRGPVNLEFAEVRMLGIIGSATQAIHGGGVVVHGDLRLRGGFDAQGEVNLVGATIANNLDCTGGRFRNAGETALNAHGTKIKGSVLLCQGFHAEGEVILFGATIAGSLNCVWGAFHNAGKDAMNVDAAHIEGYVFLRSGFQAEGLVRFSGAHIQGHLDCEGATFSGEAPNGLVGEAMVVGRFLDWRKVTTNRATILNLSGAQVGQLADDEASWPGPAHLDLDGFTYGAIFDGPADATTRLRWLARQTPVPLLRAEQPGLPPRPFRPQPYQQLAKVLRERGQEADAREILIGKEEARLTQDCTLSRKAYCWHRCLGWSLAHGYKPQRMLFAAGFVVLLGWGIFAWGDWAGLMVPSKGEVYAHYYRSGRVPPYYPVFNPLVYSLDTLLPIINFGQKDHWWPRDGTSAPFIPRQWAQLAVESPVASSRSPTAAQGEAENQGSAAIIARGTWATIRTWVTDGGALRLYRLVHIAAGWLLITLGIAGVTGLVRKE